MNFTRTMCLIKQLKEILLKLFAIHLIGAHFSILMHCLTWRWIHAHTSSFSSGVRWAFIAMFCSFGIFNSPYDDLLDTFFLSLTSTICCPLAKPANEKELFTNIMSNGVAEKKTGGLRKGSVRQVNLKTCSAWRWWCPTMRINKHWSVAQPTWQHQVRNRKCPCAHVWVQSSRNMQTWDVRKSLRWQ